MVEGQHNPPFAHIALLRAESPKLDAVPSPMEWRAGRYRAQLLVQAGERKALHDFLSAWLTWLENEKRGRQVRWSLDVDPVEMY